MDPRTISHGSFGAPVSAIPSQRPATGFELEGGPKAGPFKMFAFKNPVHMQRAPPAKFAQKDADVKIQCSADQPLADDTSKINESARGFCRALYMMLERELDDSSRSTEYQHHVLGRLFWGSVAKLSLPSASIAKGNLVDGAIKERESITHADLDKRYGFYVLYIKVRVKEYPAAGGNKPGMNFDVAELIVSKDFPKSEVPRMVEVAPDDMDVDGATSL